MPMDQFDGDPLIYDIGDGGDLSFSGGQPVMSSGIENAAYLSLFVDANWWGNDIDPANPGATGSYHFLKLISNAKLTPSILTDTEAAAKADLAWMITDGVAKSVDVSCSITGTVSMGIEITVTEPDFSTTVVRWKLNWDRMKLEAA